MNEVLEGDIRHHVVGHKPTKSEREDAEQLIEIVRSYFK